MFSDDRHNTRIEIPITDGKATHGERQDTIRDREADTDEKSESDLFREQLQRLQAEFINYKRRVEKEKEETGSYARGALIESILPVVDDLGRLIDHHAVDESVSVESIRLIIQKLDKILTDEGLEAIESVGSEFNPECHDALSVDVVSEDNDGKIIEEFQKGYRYRGRLLRPSRVKVGKAVIS